MKKINKAAARKLFNSGAAVMIAACKMNPCSAWFGGCWIQSGEDVNNFDLVVNTFEAYNCSAETGRYAAFYINA